MLKSLTAGKLGFRAAVSGEFEDLRFILEYELPRQGSLAVLLQERYAPAFFGKYELHQNLAVRRAARAVAFAWFLVE